MMCSMWCDEEGTYVGTKTSSAVASPRCPEVKKDSRPTLSCSCLPRQGEDYLEKNKTKFFIFFWQLRTCYRHRYRRHRDSGGMQDAQIRHMSVLFTAQTNQTFTFHQKSFFSHSSTQDCMSVFIFLRKCWCQWHFFSSVCLRGILLWVDLGRIR